MSLSKWVNSLKMTKKQQVRKENEFQERKLEIVVLWYMKILEKI